MRDRPIGYTRWLSFRVDGVSRRDMFSHWAPLKPGETYRISVVTDTALHHVSVYVNGQQFLDGPLPASPPVVTHTVQPETEGSPLPVTVVERPVPTPTLCMSLFRSHATPSE
jgi:hypothetical protein